MSTIAISNRTKAKLNAFGKKGETYEVIINRLLNEKSLVLQDTKSEYSQEKLASKNQESYSNFLFKIQQAKMQELWDNKEDEEWENA